MFSQCASLGYFDFSGNMCCRDCGSMDTDLVIPRLNDKNIIITLLKPESEYPAFTMTTMDGRYLGIMYIGHLKATNLIIYHAVLDTIESQYGIKLATS